MQRRQKTAYRYFAGNAMHNIQRRQAFYLRNLYEKILPKGIDSDTVAGIIITPS